MFQPVSVRTIEENRFFCILKRGLLLQTFLAPKQKKIETRVLSQIKEKTCAVRLSILQVIFKAP